MARSSASRGTARSIPWPRAFPAPSSGTDPTAVAFYLSGQLLTEDYYVANKLMKGFIGSANVDTNSRLCMASSVAGHRRAFGTDTVPGCYEDLDQADLIILVGSNAAWCHPVLYQRMVANKRARGAKIIVIDPRRTATAEDADLYLSVAPGMDSALFCGLLVHLADHLALDYGYVDAHTSGFVEALARAREIAPDVMATAALTGLSPAEVGRFFALFRTTPNVVTCFSQGVNQSASGTDKVNAIVNCHLATGRIGKPGAGPFSLTGQPNAMGGREVGGLANQLAAHMAFTPDNVDRVGRFWRAPCDGARRGPEGGRHVRGHRPRRDQGAVGDGDQPGGVAAARRRGARSLAQARSVRCVGKRRLQRHGECRRASGAAGRRLGREGRHRHQFGAAHLAAAAVPAGGGRGAAGLVDRRRSSRTAWASATAFVYESAADVFREHAALSAFENDGGRDFDIGALARLSDDEFNALDPVQWPVRPIAAP